LAYVSTTSARVILEVFKRKRKRRFAAIPGSAKPGRDGIRWNGKAGSGAAAPASTGSSCARSRAAMAASDAATVASPVGQG
jgi:hypothetical protein